MAIQDSLSFLDCKLSFIFAWEQMYTAPKKNLGRVWRRGVRGEKRIIFVSLSKILSYGFAQSGKQCQLMAKSRLREGTKPAVFLRLPEVAKQHDVSLLYNPGPIVIGVLKSARASFWLDKKIRKFVDCFNEDLPKTALVPPTAWGAQFIPSPFFFFIFI